MAAWPFAHVPDNGREWKHRSSNQWIPHSCVYKYSSERADLYYTPYIVGEACKSRPAPPIAALSLRKRFWCPPTVLSLFPIVQYFVVAVTIAGAYYSMDNNIRSDLNSIVGPTIMTAVLAYYTGKMITGVYGMAITTILQCFVADEELFPPSQQFADNDLKSWVDKHGAPMEADTHPQSRNGASSYAFS